MHKQSVLRYATFGLIALNLLIAALFLLRAPSSERSLPPELTQPRWAVAALQAKTLFFTPAASAELQARKPELLTGANVRAFAQAAQNPALFRRLDRELHFDALLLSGDPAVYRPLLGHLLDTRDWSLTYLDHTSLIFQRTPAAPWREESLNELKEKFTGRERASFLAQVAGRLLAIGKTNLAKTFLDEALTLDKKSPEALTQLAVYEGQLGRWADALTHVEQALTADKNFVPALSTKAQILFGAKRFNEALEVSERVVQANPQDPTTLFFHAKIAHEAHAYYREIDVLEKLIALAENQQQPTSGYRIYLGQAYAAKGEGRPAVEQFEKAEAAGDLTPEQSSFVKECVERIKSRAKL